MDTSNDLVDRIRTRYGLSPQTPVGVRSFCARDTTIVDETRGNRDITVVAMTDAKAMDGLVIMPRGADRTVFESNRKILVDHRNEIEYVIGSLRLIEPYPSAAMQRGWSVRFRVVSGLNNPLADDVLTLAREIGIAASIGYVPREMRRPTEDESLRYSDPDSVIDRWDWLELSVVAVPADVHCQSLAVSRDDERAQVLDEFVRRGRIQRRSAVLLGLPDTPERRSWPTRTVIGGGYTLRMRAV